MKKQKITFTLPFDKKGEVFMGEFTNCPQEFLNHLKELGLLTHVLPELFPESFDGEIVIDPFPGKETYSVDFYLTLTATKEMKQPITKYKNRDIDINEEDETLEFSLAIGKKSVFIEKQTDEKIILSF